VLSNNLLALYIPKRAVESLIICSKIRSAEWMSLSNSVSSNGNVL
jgi:hypothetical protein